MSKQETFEMIEKLGEGGLRIILYIAKNKRSKLSDFKKDLNMGSAGVYRSLKILFDFKLLIETNEGPARYFTLNDKGNELMIHLSKADDVLSKNP